MGWLQLSFEAIAAAGAVAAAIGVIFGFRQFRMQMNAQTFLSYTERYNAILADLPIELRLCRCRPEAARFASDPRVQQAYFRYFSMCSEEFYLWRERYLQQRLWRVWEAGIRQTLQSELGVAMWQLSRGEFDSYPAFQQWMEDQCNAEARAVATPLAVG